MNRSKIIIVAFLILSAVIQLWAHRAERSSRPASALKRGATAPAVSLSGVDGSAVSLADFRGKYVIIDFWASWCGPCMAEFSVLKPWWEEQTTLKDDVVFLAVSVQESRETVQNFLARSPLPFTVLLDGNASAAAKFGVEGLPTLILLGRDGAVIQQATGYDPAVAATLGGRLKALIAAEKTP